MSEEEPSSVIADKHSVYFGNNYLDAVSSLTVEHTYESQEINGETRFIDTLKLPFRDEHGVIVGTLSITRDITEQRRTVEALQKSEECFRKTFEDAPLGMIMIGSDLRVIRANKAFCKMLDYTEQGITALTVKDITDPECISEDEIRFNELMSGKIPFYRAERRYIRRNQETTRGCSTINVISNDKDQSLCLLSIVEDVPRNRPGQGEDTRLEAKIIQAQKMEAIGALAGGVAHEFNNILTTIIGFGSLLQTRISSDDPGQAYLSKIIDSSKRASQLTKSLLAFSRRQQIEMKLLRINQIVNSNVKRLRQLLTKDMELKLTLTAEDPLVMVDIDQIEQVLINFANNAREAMPSGGVLSIETKVMALDDEFISTHGYGEPGAYAVISVTDTGVGMDDKTRKHIFEPFFTTKGLGKGTGLGLSSVYGTIKQHNGYVTVSSEPGNGSTFSIYFPLAPAEKEQKHLPKEISYLSLVNNKADEALYVPISPDKHHKGTILVAEDDPWVRELISEILEGYGYDTIEATDGEETVRVFMENKEWIDLLVIDVAMPKKNGIEVYEEIRATSPNIKVLFTSGIADSMVLQRELGGGNFEFVSKPLSLDELLFKAGKALAAQKHNV